MTFEEEPSGAEAVHVENGSARADEVHIRVSPFGRASLGGLVEVAYRANTSYTSLRRKFIHDFDAVGPRWPRYRDPYLLDP